MTHEMGHLELLVVIVLSGQEETDFKKMFQTWARGENVEIVCRSFIRDTC